MRTSISILLLVILCLPPLWAKDPTIQKGTERVEAAPTVEACCRNAVDRALAHAHKLCYPSKPEKYSKSECVSSNSKMVNNSFDCVVNWNATCAKSESSDKPEAQIVDTCASITCSGHGECVPYKNKGVCICEQSYAPDPETGRECIKIEYLLDRLDEQIASASE